MEQQQISPQKKKAREKVKRANVRYADVYAKVDGKWFIKRRRTTFMISDKHVVNG